MSTSSYFNQNLLEVFYIKYKPFLLPSGVIAVCIFVFIFGIIPQLQTYFANQDAVRSDQETINIIQENINTLTQLQKSDVVANLALTTIALPKDKDFTGILNGISHAAQIANVGLGDYSFEVGDILGKNSTIQNGQLTIQVTLSIVGDLPSTQRFIDTLAKELPLSEITAIHMHGDTGAELVAIFFYKPLSTVPPSATTPLSKLSIPQQKLINSLKTDFTKPVDTSLPTRKVASESAI